MNSGLRTCLGYVSLCGFVASTAVYIIGFSESAAEDAWFAVVLLFIVWLIIAGILFGLEYPILKFPAAFWKGIPRFMSLQVILLQRLLAIGVGAHMAWCLWKTRQGVPAFINGQYVLESNGRIFQIITRSEYISLHHGLLRTSAFALVYLYFLPLVYWRHDEVDTKKFSEE